MTTDFRPSFAFRTSPWLTILRDLAMVAVCIGIVATFLVGIWESRPSPDHRVNASIADVRRDA